MMEGREGGTEEGKESTEVEEELLEPRGTPHRPHGVIQGVLRYIHLYTRGMQHVFGERSEQFAYSHVSRVFRIT